MYPPTGATLLVFLVIMGLGGLLLGLWIVKLLARRAPQPTKTSASLSMPSAMPQAAPRTAPTVAPMAATAAPEPMGSADWIREETPAPAPAPRHPPSPWAIEMPALEIASDPPLAVEPGPEDWSEADDHRGVLRVGFAPAPPPSVVDAPTAVVIAEEFPPLAALPADDNEVEILRESIANSEDRAAALASSLQQTRRDLSQARTALNDARRATPTSSFDLGEIARLQQSADEADAREVVHARDLTALREERKTLAHERDCLIDERAMLVEARDIGARARRESEVARDGLREQLRQAQEELETIHADLETSEVSKVTDANGPLGATTLGLESSQQALADAEADAADAWATATAAQGETDTANLALTQLEADREADRVQVERAQHERDVVRAELASLGAARNQTQADDQQNREDVDLAKRAAEVARNETSRANKANQGAQQRAAQAEESANAARQDAAEARAELARLTALTERLQSREGGHTVRIRALEARLAEYRARVADPLPGAQRRLWDEK